jgi:hypothetical protein
MQRGRCGDGVARMLIVTVRMVAGVVVVVAE